MSGMNSISGTGSMSRNCNMESMHRNNANDETKKAQHNMQDHKNTQTKIPDNVRGNYIDLKL